MDAACGHALVLFTSYATMSAVQERLSKEHLVWPLFTMGRNTVHTTEQFKSHPGSVLLATGAAREGFDFPGDCVSLLVIPRLPFPCPDAMKEKEREQYDTLHAFIRAVVVPEMQIKLKQGFGRAIRTETDTTGLMVYALGTQYTSLIFASKIVLSHKTTSVESAKSLAALVNVLFVTTNALSKE